MSWLKKADPTADPITQTWTPEYEQVLFTKFLKTHPGIEESDMPELREQFHQDFLERVQNVRQQYSNPEEKAFSEFEQAHEESGSEERFEVEQMISGIQDVLRDPILMLEAKEAVEQILGFNLSEAWSPEMQETEDRAFKVYIDKYPETLEKLGQEELKKHFHTMYLEDIQRIKDAIEQSREAKLK